MTTEQKPAEEMAPKPTWEELLSGLAEARNALDVAQSVITGDDWSLGRVGTALMIVDGLYKRATQGGLR